MSSRRGGSDAHRQGDREQFDRGDSNNGYGSSSRRDGRGRESHLSHGRDQVHRGQRQNGRDGYRRRSRSSPPRLAPPPGDHSRYQSLARNLSGSRGDIPAAGGPYLPNYGGRDQGRHREDGGGGGGNGNGYGPHRSSNRASSPQPNSGGGGRQLDHRLREVGEYSRSKQQPTYLPSDRRDNRDNRPFNPTGRSPYQQSNRPSPPLSNGRRDATRPASSIVPMSSLSNRNVGPQPQPQPQRPSYSSYSNDRHRQQSATVVPGPCVCTDLPPLLQVPQSIVRLVNWQDSYLLDVIRKCAVRRGVTKANDALSYIEKLRRRGSLDEGRALFGLWKFLCHVWNCTRGRGMREDARRPRAAWWTCWGKARLLLNLEYLSATRSQNN